MCFIPMRLKGIGLLELSEKDDGDRVSDNIIIKYIIIEIREVEIELCGDRTKRVDCFIV